MNKLLVLIVALIASIEANINKTNIPETSYLFSFFENATPGDGLRIAYSTDGLTFETLNSGKVFLPASLGDKILRDPCILYGPDNIFHLVWTDSWWSKDIGYASSKDLKTWSAEQSIPVMQNFSEAQNSWAPEIVYDADKKHYLIFWSSTLLGKYPETQGSDQKNNNRIYSTTTTDFKTFTATKLHYDGKFNSIDATMLQDPTHNEWLMFIKNEAADQKNVRLVKGTTPDGPWQAVSSPITGNYWAEGPTAIKIGDYYNVYFDKYTSNQMGMVRSKDLVKWEDMSSSVHFPAKTSHGTIIKITKAVATMLADEGL